MGDTAGAPPFVPPALVLGPGDRKAQPNPLLDKRQYAKLGRNTAVEARPAVVHFGGFALGERFTQTLRVVNISDGVQRLHVLNPGTPFFTARFARSKKGWLHPGMADEIVIEFQPTEWRYYYDCVRLHTGDETLLVPIHAYPVMNDVIFPRRIELGDCPLAQRTTRSVKLECNVPIQFEFEIEVAKPHPDIDISPLKGVVPSQGAVEIIVSFTPSTLSTAEVQLRVMVSQLNADPVDCVIVGGAAPGITRQDMLRQLQHTFDDEAELREKAVELPEGGTLPEDAGLVDTCRQAADVSTVVRGDGSGAVADFGGALIKSKRIKPHKGKMELKMPKFPAPAPQVELEGLQIPPSWDGPDKVNFVITQRPGKLKPKDLKAAIDEQRALRRKQKEEQDALHAAQGSEQAIPGQTAIPSIVAAARGVSDSTTRQLKELVFLQDLQEIEKSEQEREFQSQRDCLGQHPMTREEVSFVEALRAQHAAKVARGMRAAQRRSYSASKAGPYDPAAPLRVSVRAGAAGVPTFYAPAFDEFVNDVWFMRKQALQRFVLGATKVIVRIRVGKRLAAIQRLLAPCNSREDVRQLVEADNRAAAAAGVSGESDGPKAFVLGGDLDVAVLHTRSFPLYEEQATDKSKHALPVQVPHDFSDVAQLKLVEPHETDLVGHVPHEQLVVGNYMPVEATRVARRGAPFESQVLAPRKPNLVEPSAPRMGDEGESTVGDEDNAAPPPPPAQQVTLPDPETLAPPPILATPVQVDPLSLLKPGSRIRTFAEPLGRTECDVDYALRPRPRPRRTAPTAMTTMRDSVGLSSLAALDSTPTISRRWQPRRDRRISTACPVGCIPRTSLWEPEVPPLARMEIPADAMSDSESEDEGDDTIVVPTVEMSRTLFARLAVEASKKRTFGDDGVGSDVTSNGKDDTEEGSNECGMEAASASVEMGCVTFRRDQHMLALEQEKRRQAFGCATALRVRLEAAAAHVVDVRHFFTLEGHGAPLPCHKMKLLSEPSLIPPSQRGNATPPAAVPRETTEVRGVQHGPRTSS